MSVSGLVSVAPVAGETKEVSPLLKIFADPGINDVDAVTALNALGLKKTQTFFQQATEAKTVGRKEEAHRLFQIVYENMMRDIDEEDEEALLDLALLVIEIKIELAKLANKADEAETLRSTYDFEEKITFTVNPLNPSEKIKNRAVGFGSKKGKEAAKKLITQIKETPKIEEKSAPPPGINLDKTDDKGKTALILAAEKALWNSVIILLDNGAVPNATDFELQTAGDYLLQQYRAELGEYKAELDESLDESDEAKEQTSFEDESDEAKEHTSFELEGRPTWDKAAQDAAERTEHKASILGEAERREVLRRLGVNFDKDDKEQSEDSFSRLVSGANTPDCIREYRNAQGTSAETQKQVSRPPSRAPSGVGYGSLVFRSQNATPGAALPGSHRGSSVVASAAAISAHASRKGTPALASRTETPVQRSVSRTPFAIRPKDVAPRQSPLPSSHRASVVTSQAAILGLSPAVLEALAKLHAQPTRRGTAIYTGKSSLLEGRSRSVSEARPIPPPDRRGTFDAGSAALMTETLAAKFPLPKRGSLVDLGSPIGSKRSSLNLGEDGDLLAQEHEGLFVDDSENASRRDSVASVSSTTSFSAEALGERISALFAKRDGLTSQQDTSQRNSPRDSPIHSRPASASAIPGAPTPRDGSKTPTYEDMEQYRASLAIAKRSTLA